MAPANRQKPVVVEDAPHGHPLKAVMKTNDTPNSRLVYSTEQGGTCPVCNKRLDRCRCHQSATRGTGDGIVRIRRATQGRKGKAVSVISGVPGDAETLKAVAKNAQAKMRQRRHGQGRQH
ncbi:hypothetical protein [Desulfosarcina cetonica]|uniref:hypothetical protein n=1 Tax=Desulfosarcina cetonica TaxID=90730 RepID=UPI000ACCC7FF|nr:hypothetical protein [Desulfosarcina cetonica]